MTIYGELLSAPLAAAVDPVYGPVYRLDKRRTPPEGYSVSNFVAIGPDVLKLGSVEHRVIGGGYHVDERKSACAAVGETIERLALFPPGAGDIWGDTTGMPAPEIPVHDFMCCDSHRRGVHDPAGFVSHPAVDLATGQAVALPISAVYFSEAGGRAFRCTSTGAAIHETLELATASGVGEVVERDAFMGTWYARTRWPRLRVSPSGSVGRYLSKLRGQSAAPIIHLVNFSAVHGVPTVLALCLDDESQRYGIGCAVKTSLGAAAMSAANEAAAVYNDDRARFTKSLKTPKDIATFEEHVQWYQEGHGSRAQLEWLIEGGSEPITDRELERALDPTELTTIAVTSLTDSAARVYAAPFPHAWLRQLGLVGVHVLSPDTFDLDVRHTDLCLARPRLSSQWFARTFGVPAELNSDPHPFP